VTLLQRQELCKYHGIRRVDPAGITRGQKVLIHGGSGGVGHVALQLACYFGAEVWATGGGDKQLALIRELGGPGINYKTEAVADYVAEHTDGAGFDVVFDSVGGRIWQILLQLRLLTATLSRQ
jgi:NADPH2:quinone reductase